MNIKIFGKQNCAKCKTTKNKLSHFLEKNNYETEAIIQFYDLDTIDGMAEGAYHDVIKIPTTLIEREQKVLARWDGEIPKTDDIKGFFN